MANLTAAEKKALMALLSKAEDAETETDDDEVEEEEEEQPRRRRRQPAASSKALASLEDGVETEDGVFALQLCIRGKKYHNMAGVDSRNVCRVYLDGRKGDELETALDGLSNLFSPVKKHRKAIAKAVEAAAKERKVDEGCYKMSALLLARA